MTIFIDIDGTICRETGMGYNLAEPLPDAIAKVNRYYADGHTVILWTARGTETGKNWRFMTQDQLKAWGVKYHELRFGKPVWDIYICDKSVNAEDWRRLP